MVTETHPHIEHHTPAINETKLIMEVSTGFINELLADNAKLHEQLRIRDVHIRALTETINNLRDELKQHRKGNTQHE